MLKIFTLLSGGFVSLFAGLIAFIGRKFGVAASVIAMFISLTIALLACLNFILNSVIAFLSPPEWLMAAFYMIPSDFTTVMASVVSAHTCRAAFELAILKAKTFASAN